MRAQITDLYSIDELRHYPFRIYACFSSNTVHINTEEGWYHFDGKVVTPSSYVDAVKNSGCVWYVYGDKERVAVPEGLEELVELDNQRFAEELSII